MFKWAHNQHGSSFSIMQRPEYYWWLSTRFKKHIEKHCAADLFRHRLYHYCVFGWHMWAVQFQTSYAHFDPVTQSIAMNNNYSEPLKKKKLQQRAAPREYFDPPTSLRAAASSRQRGENFASDPSHSEKPSVEKSSHYASLSERKLSSQQLSQPCLHQHHTDTLTQAERDTNVIPVNTWRQRILLNYLTF